MALILRSFFAILLMAVLTALPKAAEAQPAFSKTFAPDTIGLGGTSILTFTIANGAGSPVTDLDFTDNLPAAVTISPVPDASTTCTGGTLTAPANGSTISYTGGALAGSTSCTISVNVTSSTAGTHTNTTGDLTSSAGNSGTATDDLTVNVARPSFSKSFAPPSIPLFGISTLTYTIDNSAGGVNIFNASFSETLPSGLVIASPANSSISCIGSFTPTSGSSAINLFSGFLTPGEVCTLSVDVTSDQAGVYNALSSNLSSSAGTSGASVDSLEVTGPPSSSLQITKQFLNDPVGPGGSATLEFRLNNAIRGETVTNIAFTDNLDAMLTGATSGSTLFNDCGGTGTGTGTFSYAGGTLGDGAECTIRIAVNIPAGATPGNYPNTTSTVTGTTGSGPVTGNAAVDTLRVAGGVPDLSKTFTTPTITAGLPATMEFTITNPSSTSAMTDITFTDNLSAFLSGATVTGGGGAGVCGAGSSVFAVPSGGEQILQLSGGTLPASGSCTFSVTVSTPADTPGSIYTNTTSAINATVGGVAVVGPAASDSLTVNGGVNLKLRKEFTNNPVAAGGTATLDITIDNTEGAVPISGLSFTDNLDAMLTGAQAISANSNTCGGMAGGFPASTFSYGGGSVAAGATCTISLNVSVPGGTATGDYTNTISDLTGTAGAVTVNANTATATLSVLGVDDQPVTLSKQFIGGPFLPGQTATLEFTITNPNPGNDATGIFFTDSLSGALSGLSTTGALPSNPCGAGSSLSGTTFLIFTGGTLPAGGGSCTFSVNVLIPAGASSGSYGNVTSSVTATVNGTATTGDPAAATLVVEESQLEITKTFVDPVTTPGALARMEITVTNPTSSVLTTATYTDDLNAMLPGTTAGGNGFVGCSGGVFVAGSGTSNLTVTISNLPAGESCTHRFFVQPPSGAAPGSYTNTISDLSGTVGGLSVTGPTTSASLQIRAIDAPIFSKAFAAPSVIVGETVDLTFTIINTKGTDAISDLQFSDDLDAFLTGAVATGLPASACGGTISGTDFLTFTGGSLAGSASCDITVPVQIPVASAGGNYTNTTSDLTQNGLSLAAAASTSLTVNAEADLSVTLSDSPDPVFAGETLTYTIVASNAGPSADPSVTLSDTFPAGLTCNTTSVAAGGATGNTAAGSGDLSETLNMPAGSSVTYTASCVVGGSAVSPLSNTVTISGTIPDPDAGNNSATEGTVTTPRADISITKTDGITSVRAGDPLTYTIVVSNAGPSADPSVSVSDTFPANMNCGYSSVAAGGATGNGSGSGDPLADTLNMPAGSSVTYTASCVVAGDATGTLSNTADATASVNDPNAGNNSATDNDTVVVVPDLGFAKTFAPTVVNQGETSTMQFTIDNTTNAVAASGMVFSDDFPAGLEVASPANATNTCGGTFTATAGATSVSLAGGNLGAGSSCTVSVDVRAIGGATVINTTSVLTSSLPDAAAASATLTINPAGAPGFAKSFNPNPATQGETVVLTLAIDNSANIIEATTLAFTDTFPAGLVVGDTPSVANSCGGTVTADAGTNSVSLSGGAVNAGAQCEISVNVRPLAAGTLSNTSGDLTSNLATAAGASADLVVTAATAPALSMAFNPGTVNQGDLSVLTLSIDNSANLIEAASLALSGTLPSGLVIGAPVGLSNSCGGTVTANAGTAALTLSGGTVAAGASCEIALNVQAQQAGAFTLLVDTLSSTLGASPAASANLTVNALPLGVSLTFSPASIEQFQTTTLTYTLNNTAGIAATAVALNDSLPAGVTIATPANAGTSCGGTLSAAGGGSSVALSGGSVPAGGSCSISVSVTSGTVGAVSNAADTVTSSLGVSTSGTAGLTVTPGSTGTLTIVQNTDTDGAFVFSSLEGTPVLNFTINTAGGTGQQGPITVPAGSYTLVQSGRPDGVGTTSITCTDDNSTGNARAGTVALNIAALETVSCTFTAISSRQKTVDTINRFLTRRADLILSSEPSNGRRLDRLKRGSGNASALSFAQGDLKSFLPFSAQLSPASDSYSLSTSLLQMRQATASLALAHDGNSDGARYVENYRWDAWFEAQYKKFDSGGDDGHFAIAYLGADYLVNPDLLVGAMLQIDTMEDRSPSQNSKVSGTGWMFGPYVTTRLGPNLYFDGRIAAGTSRNDISPFNTYTDEFTTQRWLATAELSGDFQRGNWTIQPAASLSYFEEQQNSYTDGIGVLIPSQTVSLGQVKLGPTFTGQFQTRDGTSYSPYISIDAIYNFGDTSGVTVTNAPTASTDGWRGRIQGGVDFSLQNGARISLGGSYDGIGRDSLDVWGLSFKLDIPLQKPTAR